jgi:preprotein translocase subunit YajC
MQEQKFQKGDRVVTVYGGQAGEVIRCENIHEWVYEVQLDKGGIAHSFRQWMLMPEIAG